MMRVPVFAGEGRLEIMERPVPKITALTTS